MSRIAPDELVRCIGGPAHDQMIPASMADLLRLLGAGFILTPRVAESGWDYIHQGDQT